MIAPHTSCRYAVVSTEAFADGSGGGYVIAAVHAIDTEGRTGLLVSRVSPNQAPLSFRAPEWVSKGYVLRLCANFRDASATRGHLVEEDHRAEMAERVRCSNHPDRRAVYSPTPGVTLCNDCAVDWDRDVANAEAIR